MDSINLDKSLKNDRVFRGPIQKRSCTDFVCLLIFAVFILGWLLLGFFAIKYGDPEQLIFPSDSYGQICGRNKLRDKPYLYFFNIIRCTKLEAFTKGCNTTQICVSSCPNYTASFVKVRTLDDFKRLPFESKSTIREKLICTYDVNVKIASDEEIVKYLQQKKCGLVYFESIPIAGRCIPIGLHELLPNLTHKWKNILDEDDKPFIVEDTVKNKKELSNLINLKIKIKNILQDLSRTWSIIIWTLVIATVISFLWILCLQIIAGVMVWLSILAVLIISSIIAFLSFQQYIYLRDLPPEMADEDFNDHSLNIDPSIILTTNLNSWLNDKTLWFSLIIFFGFLTIILLLTFIFLRKRIKIAISLIEEASKAINCAKSSLIFPLVPYFFQILVIGASAFFALLIAASKKKMYRISQSNDPIQNGLPCNPFNFTSIQGSLCTPYQYFSDDIITYAQIYNLFVGLWLLFFIKGMSQLILAGTFSAYYWAFHKPKDIPTFPLLKSTYRAFRYHMGSVAFGSLLLAIIRLIRIVIEYIHTKCKKYENNAVIKAISCLFRCCFWMLEKFMIFLNTNAYIMLSIHGKPFLSSARDAFSLLMRNIIRLAVVDKVADYILFVGKLVVTAFMGLSSYYYFSQRLSFIHFLPHVPDLNYSWSPVLFICIFTFLIASTFFNVYNMAVDTIFLCFLEDCDRNDGSAAKPYYMSKKLMQILDYRNKL